MSDKLMPDKPMTDDEYTLAEGNRCPVCRTDMIEGGSIEVNAGTATQEVSCLLCHAEWTDIYNLVGYCDLTYEGRTLNHLETEIKGNE